MPYRNTQTPSLDRKQQPSQQLQQLQPFQSLGDSQHPAQPPKPKLSNNGSTTTLDPYLPHRSTSSFRTLPLDYFTNNHFSTSFNSLILDDGIEGVDSKKKVISRSSPFNIKDQHEYLADGEIDEAEIEIDIDTLKAKEPTTDTQPDADNMSTNINSSDALFQLPEMTRGRVVSVNTNSTITSDVTTIDDTIIEPRSQSASQQSSIKRSSKFLNLSIDSSNKFLENTFSSGGNVNSNGGTSSLTYATGDGNSNSLNAARQQVYEDIDYISDLNEIDSSIIRSNTPVNDFSSPIGSKTTPFNSKNKFKRPHILISQSPSPNSSSVKGLNKTQIFKQKSEQQQHQQLNQQNSQTSQNKCQQESASITLKLPKPSIPNDISKLYSPSKLGTNFKLLKNSNKDAIISPNRLTPTKSSVKVDTLSTTSGLFNSRRVLTSGRKSSLNTDEPSIFSNTAISNNNIRSPFTDSHSTHSSSSPVSNNFGFEYYNLDNLDCMEIDNSPSKGKKFSNSSMGASNSNANNSNTNHNIIVYQDNESDSLKTRKKLRNEQQNVPTVLEDDKENFELSKKPSNSYKFVKPLQTAFKSTGLVKKSSIHCSDGDRERKLPPETPMKRHPIMLLGNSSNISFEQQQTQLPQPLTSSFNNPRTSSLSHMISSAHEDIQYPDGYLENSIEVGRNAVATSSQDNSIDTSSSFFKFALSHNTSKSTILHNFAHNNGGDLDIEFSGSEIDFDRSNSTSSQIINNQEILANLNNSNLEECSYEEDIIPDGDILDENDMIPETPTKASNMIKKSSSIPPNFLPVSFSKLRSLKSGKELKKLPNLNSLQACKFKLKSSEEPSTPILHLQLREGKLLSKNQIFNVTDSDLTLPTNVSTLDSINSVSQATLCREEVCRDKKIDDHLSLKFGAKNIKYIGTGEFSIAFECSLEDQKLAIKRSKKQIIGKLERKAISREIDALRALTSVKDNDKLNQLEQEAGKEYLVYFIEAWEFNNFYYIMTEYCEGGTLFDFVEENKNYKIDEFRIWKILIEILNGLKFIHLHNYLHLDLKPANIFITFEGSLKIGDFGLATKLPILEKDFDLEGDRNYIAPELINDKIYTPFADVFSVGLIILEIAANIILPDNGTPWRKLRSGDLSDAGKLSSDNISDFLLHQNFSSLSSYNSGGMSSNSSLSNQFATGGGVSSAGGLIYNVPHTAITSTLGLGGLSSGLAGLSNIRGRNMKDCVPAWAPEFLVGGSVNNLDALVSKMLKPNPFDRPTAKMILETNECVIIENRRKAGATIFEGEFGPSHDDE